MRAICAHIRKPTTISAGAVAAAGTTPTTARQHRGRNRTPTNTECSPVRAPSATPAADSMYDVTELTPNSPPIDALDRIDREDAPEPGNLPSLVLQLRLLGDGRHRADRVEEVHT